MDFIEQQLPGGIKLSVFPTDQFKTTLMQVFFHQPLNREQATMTALLPAVLQRGYSRFPETLQFQRALEELYGAQFNTSILKKGEDQVVVFSLELIGDNFSGSEENVLQQGWEIINGVISEPLLESGAFRSSYVDQEKEQLGKIISGLINEKTTYAIERCIQEMCSNEPFGIYKFGDKQDLPKITAKNLYDFYRRWLSQAVEVYVIGNVDPDKIYSMLSSGIGFSPNAKAMMPATEKGKKVTKERLVEEKRAVSQGKLTLGYRTGITYGDQDYYSLLVYNGILGGFPHSKLFQNVREKASLAYYAMSRIVKHKDILLIASGIEEQNYQQALEIICRQVEIIAQGNISEEELDNTRLGLMNQLQVQEDSPYSRIQQLLDASIAGIKESSSQVQEAVKAVTKDDIVRVAENINLDTIYFLRGKESENND